MVSVALSLLIAWLAIYLLRLFSGVVVWFVILAVIGASIALTIYLYSLGMYELCGMYS